jgi:membrane protein YdbS with pleckstrin-like domain
MTVPGLIHQKPYEHVEYVLRRHPITFVPKIIVFLILFFAPFALYSPLQTTFPNLLSGPVSFPLIVLFISIYLLTILLFFYTMFTTFYLDVSVITNDRIVDIEQLGLFANSTGELDLFRIQDVTSEVKGIFATLFDYGTVFITTASNNSNIILHNIHHPNNIRNALIRLAEEDRKYHQVNT